jgi:archaemetzincin
MTHCAYERGMAFLIMALATGNACGSKRESGLQRAGKGPERNALKTLASKLEPLHTRLGPPQPGDWLAEHDEPGQTFEQYLKAGPVDARGERRTIYIQPIGRFTPAQRRVVDRTADFMGIYFGLPVAIREGIPVGDGWPKEARRVHPSWGDEQLLTGYILEEVLQPRLPDDAAVLLGFTAWDLWPGKGWNFVFGQASTRNRAGVWSIYRNGEPEKGGDDFRLCLLRTIKTAVHETGHMFTMRHCTAYHCCMNGSNHRLESDSRPLALCPECLTKLVWATGVDPLKRFRSLADFCTRHGLKSEARFFQRSAEAIAR